MNNNSIVTLRMIDRVTIVYYRLGADGERVHGGLGLGLGLGLGAEWGGYMWDSAVESYSRVRDNMEGYHLNCIIL